MKIKRNLSIFLTLVMLLGMIPGMSLTAQAADNSTDYTVTIPATLSVANSGWNNAGGIIAAVKSGDTFDTGKKLTVSAASANSWALKSGDNSVGYNLATATGTYSSTAEVPSWEFSATELNTSGGTNKTMGIIVDDYSTKPAGTYQDTVTFTASVEEARQLYSFTLTGPYTHQTLVVEYYEGDTWNDMAKKYPNTIEIYRGYVVFGSDGFIRVKSGSMVSATAQIDPNETYEVQ